MQRSTTWTWSTAPSPCFGHPPGLLAMLSMPLTPVSSTDPAVQTVAGQQYPRVNGSHWDQDPRAHHRVRHLMPTLLHHRLQFDHLDIHRHEDQHCQVGDPASGGQQGQNPARGGPPRGQSCSGDPPGGSTTTSSITDCDTATAYTESRHMRRSTRLLWVTGWIKWGKLLECAVISDYKVHQILGNCKLRLSRSMALRLRVYSG